MKNEVNKVVQIPTVQEQNILIIMLDIFDIFIFDVLWENDKK